MAIADETLKSIIRDFHGFDLSDAELKLIRPELESYMAEVERLRQLDLSAVMSGRLLHADEGGASDAES